MMKEFEVKGRRYRAGKLNAFDQFHVGRRMAPFLGALAPVFSELLPKIRDDKELKDDEMMAVITPLSTALSQMQDEEANYCIFKLLDVVSRRDDGGSGWASVITGKQLMFADIETDMVTMLQLVWNALQYNLSGFFPENPSALSDALQQLKNKSSG